MNKGIIALLIGIILAGVGALYVIERGPALFLRPPAQERIAFISEKDGRSDIWTMKTDGSDKIRATNDEAVEQAPSWSPKGTELAFISNRDDETYEVFVSAWNGTYSRRMTTSEGTKDIPLWSTDGSEITYLSSGKVFMRNRHGGQEKQYLPPTANPSEAMQGQFSQPCNYAEWSPGMDALLYVQSTELGEAAYVIEQNSARLADSDDIRPVEITSARIIDAAWGPSGKKVAVAGINGSGGNGLIVVDLETLEVDGRMDSKGPDSIGPVNPVWSPDGEKIAFEMWQLNDGIPDKCLGVYTINTSGPVKRTEIFDGDAGEPSWSPDGKQLVCTVARKDGKRDIWRVDADGSNAVNLTKGEGDNHSPVWSPALQKKS